MKFSEITECPQCHSKFIKQSKSRFGEIEEKECMVCFCKKASRQSVYDYEIPDNLNVVIHNWRYFEYKGLIRDVDDVQLIKYIEEYDLSIVLGHEELLTIFSDGSETSEYFR